MYRSQFTTFDSIYLPQQLVSHKNVNPINYGPLDSVSVVGNGGSIIARSYISPKKDMFTTYFGTFGYTPSSI